MAEPATNQPQSAFSVFEEAFARAAGTPLVTGNEVRLLRDAGENYPAWLEAIAAARRTIHFESYIIHDDETGQQFARALKARAAEGVRVRVIYDWLGAVAKTSRRFWRELREGGIEVRCFNPPRLSSPFAWISRDHRKMLAVDGRVAFVTGLCVGRAWVGDPARGVEPWRDTGIAVRGPAVADLESAFARMWALAGAPIADAELPTRESLAAGGGRRGARHRGHARNRGALSAGSAHRGRGAGNPLAHRRLLRRHDRVRAVAPRGGA